MTQTPEQMLQERLHNLATEGWHVERLGDKVVITRRGETRHYKIINDQLVRDATDRF